MALVTCPECSTQVPDKVAACPECGCPLASVASPAVAAPIPYAPPGSPQQPPHESALRAPPPPVPLPQVASPPLQRAAQQPDLPQPKTGMSGLMIALMNLGVLVLVGGGIAAYAVSKTASHNPDENTVAVTAVTPPARPNDGTDPHQPILPAGEESFVDSRGGWGWGDKCWIHLKAGKWGWAKAECDRGMAMNPASPQPRASLLYNEGLVAMAAGNNDEARGDFTASLVLRENAEVRSALNGL